MAEWQKLRAWLTVGRDMMRMMATIHAGHSQMIDGITTAHGYRSVVQFFTYLLT